MASSSDHHDDAGRGTGRDAAERSRLLATLRDSEQRFTNVIQACPLGVHMYVLDANDRLIFDGYNPAADRILGVDHEQFLGKTLSEAFPPLEQTEVPDRYRQVALDGSPWEHEQIDYDDQVIRGAFEIKAFQTRARAMAVMFRDITEQRRATHELQKARDTLEERVRERTANLTEANRELRELTLQLVHSAKLAALGELTAGIAHELNQPLNAMKIACQGMLLDVRRSRLETDRVGEKLETVVALINKMAELITHMRIFTRPSTGVPFEVFDLNEVVTTAFAFVGQQLKDRGVDVETRLSSSPAAICGDKLGLEQVLLSLLSNARHAVEQSGKSEKRITVESTVSSGRVRVSVTDSGQGISTANRDKVFQPFFTGWEPGQGTGLGLSIAKKIVDEHQGQLSFESEAGKFCRFQLEFRMAGSQAGEVEP